MIKNINVPVKTACIAVEIYRSSFYKSKQSTTKEADLVKTEIEKIILEFPRYGYRRVTKELHRREKKVNHKRVLNIMKANNWLCRKKKFKPITTQSNHGLPLYPNLIKCLVVIRLNQVWVADITYIHLGKEFIYLAAIIDIFSRKCVGWALGRSIDAQLAIDALNMALKARRYIGFENLIHHSDKGVQYASHEYVNKLKAEGIHISMTETGNPRENAYAESFMKTFKVEEVYIKEYETFEDAYKNIKHFIELVYNAKRLHSGIGYMPPEEFENEVLKSLKHSLS